MTTTRHDWTSGHPRFAADLSGNRRADILGIGPDCIGTCLNRGTTGFDTPLLQLAQFDANSGWRIGDHPRFLMDLKGDGRPDQLGFGDVADPLRDPPVSRLLAPHQPAQRRPIGGPGVRTGPMGACRA